MCKQFGSPDKDITIAMHEKEHILKAVYPENTWVWNTFKSTIVESNKEGTVPMMSTPQQQLDSSSTMPPQQTPHSKNNRQKQLALNPNHSNAREKRIQGRPEILPPWIAPPPPPPSITQSNARIDDVEAAVSSYRSSSHRSSHRFQHGKVSVPVMARGGAARGIDSQQPQPQQPQQLQPQQQQQQQQLSFVVTTSGRNHVPRLSKPMPLPLPAPLDQQNGKEGGVSIEDRRVVDYGRAQARMSFPGQAADKVLPVATIDNGPRRPDVLSSRGRYHPNTNRAAVA